MGRLVPLLLVVNLSAEANKPVMTWDILLKQRGTLTKEETQALISKPPIDENKERNLLGKWIEEPNSIIPIPPPSTPGGGVLVRLEFLPSGEVIYTQRFEKVEKSTKEKYKMVGHDVMIYSQENYSDAFLIYGVRTGEFATAYAKYSLLFSLTSERSLNTPKIILSADAATLVAYEKREAARIAIEKERNEKFKVRRAAEAEAKKHKPDAKITADALKAIAASDKSFSATEEPLRILKKSGDASAVEPLLNIVKNTHVQIYARANVVETLAEIGDKSALPMLREILDKPAVGKDFNNYDSEDEDKYMRIRVMRAFRKLDQDKSKDLYEKLVNAENEFITVRVEAAMALKMDVEKVEAKYNAY